MFVTGSRLSLEARGFASTPAPPVALEELLIWPRDALSHVQGWLQNRCLVMDLFTEGVVVFLSRAFCQLGRQKRFLGFLESDPRPLEVPQDPLRDPQNQKYLSAALKIVQY